MMASWWSVVTRKMICLCQYTHVGSVWCAVIVFIFGEDMMGKSSLRFLVLSMFQVIQRTTDLVGVRSVSISDNSGIKDLVPWYQCQFCYTIISVVLQLQWRIDITKNKIDSNESQTPVFLAQFETLTLNLNLIWAAQYSSHNFSPFLKLFQSFYGPDEFPDF